MDGLVLFNFLLNTDIIFNYYFLIILNIHIMHINLVRAQRFSESIFS